MTSSTSLSTLPVQREDAKPWALDWLHATAATTADIPDSQFQLTLPGPTSAAGHPQTTLSSRVTSFVSSAWLDPALQGAIGEMVRMPIHFVQPHSGLRLNWGPDLFINTPQGAIVVEFKVPRLIAADLVEQLRDSASLSMGDVANLLGVSRRSAYTWREGRAPRADTATKLQLIAAAIRPLASEMNPTELRTWLISGEPRPTDLIRSGDLAAFAAAAEESASSSVAARGSSGTFVGRGADRIYDLSAVRLERVGNRPTPRPEPLDWDY